MNKRETASFLAVVKTAYPHFEITEPVVRLWHEFMVELPFQTAQANLKEHIKSNRFPPTISEIVRHDSETFTNQLQLEAETRDRFDEMQEWERKAVEMPEAVRQRIEYGQRLLRQGGRDS